MSHIISFTTRARFLSQAACLVSQCLRQLRPSLSRQIRAYSNREADSINELFGYTSGRFLFNEQLRLKERYVVFDVTALKTAAEEALGAQHGPVVDVSKLAEGGFNRVLLLRMQDGFELVAKIPYHIAVPDLYSTASEVATLDFLRSQEIPVPEVYQYSANSDNPVGVEYILMQKAPGTALTTKWQSLSTVQIKRVAHSVMEIEKKLFELPFSATGSIYYKQDLHPELQMPLYKHGEAQPESDKFCIGPIADYMFWYGRRASLPMEHGPWKDPTEYLRSIADKEIEWTKQFGTDREPDFPFNTLEVGRQPAQSYITLLEKYKKLTPYLLPSDHDSPLVQATLRHPDLTSSNIFVSTETDRVSCLIDWQHAVLQPRLLAAGHPRSFENPEIKVPRELIEPSLPKDLETLDSDSRAEVEESYRRHAMFYYYRVFTGAFNKAHQAAISDPLLQLRQLLVDRAGRQWNGNLVTLKGAILRTSQHWDKLMDTKGIRCPVQFDKADTDSFLALEERWLEMNFAVENWRDQICFMNEDGWVPNEDFVEAKAKLEELEKLVLSQCDEEDRVWFENGWPFQDHDEVD